MRMKRTICLMAVIATTLARMAAAAPKQEINAIIDREYPSLEKIYIGVHQAPELSLMEEKTSAMLAGELRKAGYDVTEHFGGLGVGAVVKKGEGRNLLVGPGGDER